MEQADGDGQKPSVLIIGGLGFIGRHLAKYIHDNQLASSVRLADKVLPQLAHLAPEFTEACSQSVFMHADASREPFISRIFEHPSGPEKRWDYVFNLGGETAWSQTAEIYKLRIHQLSVGLGKEAAKQGVKAFVEASTGMVYAPERKPRKESDKLKPWLGLGKSKLEAEHDLSCIPDLNLIILRIAHVYGEYDSGFLAKALCLARVYQETEKDLKWLWTEELKVNTVHVLDVVRALWQAAEWRSKNTSRPEVNGTSPKRFTTVSRGEDGPWLGTPVFNIVDHGDTSQGALARIVSEVFGIKTGFHGSLVSQWARLNLDRVVDDLNEDNLQEWSEILERNGIVNPGPLSPFLEKELLRDTDLSLDGGLFEITTGFEYRHAENGLDVSQVKLIIESYKRMGWWPMSGRTG